MKYLLLLVFTITCSQLPTSTKYDRKDWAHWSDEDRDCLDTRHEILKERSQFPVKTKKKGCRVVTGRWEDYYYPEIHTNVKKVDIDHLVPLKNAHVSGGDQWSRQKKETFANDPENLVITDRKYNRKKGSKGIDQWLPVHPEYACKYIRAWVRVKKKYQLKILPDEEKTISTSKCL